MKYVMTVVITSDEIYVQWKDQAISMFDADEKLDIQLRLKSHTQYNSKWCENYMDDLFSRLGIDIL